VLRKRLPNHYLKFDHTTRAALKQELLGILASEPERTVRHGVVGVVAVLAKADCSSGNGNNVGGGWPELWQFLGAASNNTQYVEAREMAFMALEELVDVLVDQLQDNFQHMAGLFQAGLNDSSNIVQKAAVKALGALLSMIADEPPHIDVFSDLLPATLAIAAKCNTQHNADEDTVSVVLDVLFDLAYCQSPNITKHLVTMVQFCLSVITNDALEMSVRDLAALVIATLAEAKPKTFGKEEQMLNAVLDTLFGLMDNSSNSMAGALFESNPEWKADLQDELHHSDDVDGDEDWDAPTETSMAQGTLDMLACELPKKYIFEPAVSRCMARLNSDNANARKAGIAALGVVAEGCSEPLREHLHDVMPHVFQKCGDSEAQVRECACFALGQLSEHCRPEILGFASQILPIVFALLDDTTTTVQVTSCYVLEMFCERLEPDAVRPLLDPLVRKLAGMLEASTKRSVQEMAVAALAATAVAAEEEFTPYVGGVASLMTKLMALRDDERMFSLRGRALECMGHIAIAVGRDTFRPYFATTMQCAMEGLSLDSTELHEFAYAVFANLSKVMQEEFAPALSDLVPHLLQVIRSDEGQLETVKEAQEVSEMMMRRVVSYEFLYNGVSHSM
jgi:hypothetical protein